MENFVHQMYKLFGFGEIFKYIGQVECTELLNSTKNFVYQMYKLSGFEKKFKYVGFMKRTEFFEFNEKLCILNVQID